jgi:hypothetical protein
MEFDSGLEKIPFTSAKETAKLFSTSLLAMSRIIRRRRGLHKFSRRWFPDDLAADQKQSKCAISEELLNGLRNDESACFSRVTRGDEFWFS